MGPEDSKFFEAAQALGQSISQWDLLIIGGSLVLIVSTSYYRPASRRMRFAYFLFLPAWALLALSVYAGIEIQGSYVAYLVATRAKSGAGNATVQQIATKVQQIATNMEAETRFQISCLEYALLCLAAWLLIYIGWWVLSDQPRGDRK